MCACVYIQFKRKCSTANSRFHSTRIYHGDSFNEKQRAVFYSSVNITPSPPLDAVAFSQRIRVSPNARRYFSYSSKLFSIYCVLKIVSRICILCSIQLYRLISVASFIFGHRSIIVSQYFNISSGNRRKHTVTMKNQQSLRFNNSYFTTCFRNYTNRIRGIRPFKHPSPRIEFIKRASLFALILAASSFDNRVAREAAIQRRERRRFPTVFNPCTRVYVYVYTHA